MNSDALFEITKNVKDVKSLVLMCSLNKDMLSLCQNYSKQVFLTLMKNATFRKSFFNTSQNFIKTQNFKALLSLMKWYPVGKMFPHKLNYMNLLQLELLNDTFKFSNCFLTLFKLLFYPTNYITFSLEELTKCYKQLPQSSIHTHFFNILTFHFNNSNKFYKTQKEFRQLVNRIVSHVHIVSHQDIAIFEKILDALFLADETSLQLTLFGAIFSPVVNNQFNANSSSVQPVDITNISIDSEELQDEYADTYEFIKIWYKKYALDIVRQKYMGTQSGGSLLALAKSPLARQIGKDIAKQGMQQLTGQRTQQLLHQASNKAINNASTYVQSKTGVKIDTTDLQASVNKSISK